MNAINTVLPLEGAPKAIPGTYATAGGPAFGKTDLTRRKPLGDQPNANHEACTDKAEQKPHHGQLFEGLRGGKQQTHEAGDQ